MNKTSEDEDPPVVAKPTKKAMKKRKAKNISLEIMPTENKTISP